MKFLFMLAVLTLLCASLAGAQTWPYNNDDIGMYFDEAATNYCCGSAPGTFVNVYLVLTNASCATVGGWEAAITFESAGGALPTAMVPRYDNVDAATREHEFIVGFGTPQPTDNGRLVLMDITLYVLDGMIPCYGYVGPIYFHSAPEALPAYLDGADLGNIKVMYPITGSVDDWVISLNNGCVVDNEAASFGSVKSLFR